jgi:hypothetical protein
MVSDSKLGWRNAGRSLLSSRLPTYRSPIRPERICGYLKHRAMPTFRARDSVILAHPARRHLLPCACTDPRFRDDEADPSRHYKSRRVGDTRESSSPETDAVAQAAVA